MLGLDRHIVKVVPYENGWVNDFRLAQQVLEKAIGPLVTDIQHVGSTAVPGLAAKPILDIAIAVEHLDVVQDCIAPLEAAGYEYDGDAGMEGGHLFVQCSAPDVRTHHLHIVKAGGVQWRHYLAFRDYLAAHPEVAREYADLKRRLGARFAEDRPGYTRAKAPFICRVLDEVDRGFGR